MDVFCSLRSVVGGVCGYDKKDRNRDTQIVSLSSCKKDISKHMSALGFSGIEHEVDLILCRAGLFNCKADRISSMTVCPHHRAMLGLGWTRGSSTRCRVPPSLSGHGKAKASWPKGDRGLGKKESQSILRKTGVFVQVGSGICRKCREELKFVKEDSVEEQIHLPSPTGLDILTDELDKISLAEDETKILETPQTTAGSFLADTPFTMYQPSGTAETIESQKYRKKELCPREKLNEFLASRDISPVRNSMNLPWNEASERTKRHYTRKARQVVSVALKEISPVNSDMLLEAVKSPRNDDSSVDSTLMQALAECYNNATHWSTRRQILSIMADKVSFKELLRWVPLTRYRYSIARHHALLHGRGAVVPPTKNTRMYVSPQKLDHFLTFITSTSVIQDLPFGEKSLTLSSNTKITVPNVIRTLIPEQIVQQYQSYCKESGFAPMSRSTLCRILKVCSASVRKSLQGLDYISAEGSKAFDEVEDVLEKLGDVYGMGHTWAKEQSDKLKLAKRYLKGDYKVHVAPSSRVADHCRAHALSYKKDKDTDHFISCDHQHDLQCDRCHLIPTVFDEINSAIKDAPIPNEEKEEITHIVSQSKKGIEAWKAHLLRSVNQDEARLDILKNLDANSVLIVLDWAMKFLPRKYRESQADWFGKRGIPWHIAVVTRKLGCKTETLTFVHIFQKCSQDSPTVLSIVDDVVKQLKTVMPRVKKVYLRQDNAGCYHSAPTILTLQQIATKYKVQVRLDFSDPQGGKGACDRKAASLKSHIKMYLNSGKDVDDAGQMKKAIESLGGVPGVRVMICDPPACPVDEPPKWEGISFINNFAYSKDGITTWREYGIGPGKFLKWSQFSLPKKYRTPELEVTKDAESPKAEFVEIRTRSKPNKPQGTEMPENEERTSNHTEEERDSDTEIQLFSCPFEGCVKSYQRYSSLQHHLDIGEHKYALEHETLLDKAMLQYAKKLDHGTSAVQLNPSEAQGVPQRLDYFEPLPMGWALKTSAKRKRLTPTQKTYLTSHFDIGEQTGHKVDPKNVSTSMRKARNQNGLRVFEASDFLTPQQISSFFSRLAKKRRRVNADNTEADEVEEDEDDLAEQLEEENFQELREGILNEISISHPILFETHNICDLAASSKLSKFSVQMLHDICAYFELETSARKTSTKRKKPYIDLLKELVASCTCNKSLQ